MGGIICKDDGTNVKYYHYDAIGNVVATSGDNGNLSESFVQDSFGNVLSGTAAGYHLTTKEYFSTTGLYFFNARWYDPETGRFISRAKMPPDAEHPYAYCENNPVNMVDPTGLIGFQSGFRYGKYCGKNWPTEEDRKKDLPADNKVDAACENHDDCYSDADCLTDKDDVKDAKKECDEGLCDDLAAWFRSNEGSNEYNRTEQFAAAKMIWSWFCKGIAPLPAP